ncbi:hypothetical protein IAT40_000767 [Kwoniella sp. CBS 6097]
MKVFWPTRGIERTTGDVVGWRMADDTICVIAIIQKWSRTESEDEGKDEMEGLEKIGIALPVSDTSARPSSPLTPIFWLPRNRIPAASSQPIELILYTPPETNRLRFLRSSSTQYNGVRVAQIDELSKQYGYGAASRAAGKGKLGILDEVIELINRSMPAQKRLAARSSVNLTKLSTETRVTSRMPSSGARSTFTLLLSPVARLARTINTHASISPSSSLFSVREYSSMVNQICLRLAQAIEGPERFKSTQEVVCIQERSDRYINFWNTVWLVINDIILGYSARQLILLSAHTIHHHATRYFSAYLVELPIVILQWLNDWPVGLKLNTPLSQFFCTSLGMIVGHWGAYIEPLLQAYGPILLQIIAWTSFGGLTLTLAILSDILSIFTIHLHLCHILMRTIYRWQLESLGGLWNLFRGKRWNVLRQRTDSYAYDVDQLFLGTLLFTVSAFLFPTVLTYAALFAAIRMVLFIAKKSLAYMIDALNAFPLFELLLRIKEPSRLPAGVQFELHQLASESAAKGFNAVKGRYRVAHAWELKNAPKSFVDIIRPDKSTASSS